MQAIHSNIRIVLVDDTVLFRAGLKEILSSIPHFDVVGEAANIHAAEDLCSRLKPDLTLIEYQIQDSCKLTRRLLNSRATQQVLMLTTRDDEQMLYDCLRAGASGLTLKTASFHHLVLNIESVIEGKLVIPDALLRQILSDVLCRSEQKNEPTADPLTARELEVLQCMSTGVSNKEISKALNISLNTVQNHVGRILSKLHLENRAQATAYALRYSFTPPQQHPIS